jgi:Ribosomal protein L14E/L6E/L27E
VKSTSGRDAGKYSIILKVLNEKYVLIADGNLRTIEKPKKKKIKHLKFTNIKSQNILDLILQNKPVSNSILNKFLQSRDIDKEV